jgi:TolA-binding protein
MANSARTKPGQEPATVTLNEGPNQLDKVAFSYEKNKKVINTTLTVVILAVAGYFGYKNFVAAPKNEKAALAMRSAEQFFAMDSVNLALNGDAQVAGFLKIIKKYDGTPSANAAQYYAGVCYLKMGDFKNAIKYLQAFNAHGTALEHAASGLLGDAYMESGDVKKGIENYKSATSDATDDVFSPIYLQRLAVAYEKNNQPEDAKKAYARIRDEYPRSMQARDVDKSLAKMGELN